MAIASLEDLDGTTELLVFPEAFAKYGLQLRPESAIFVRGKVDLRDDKPKVMADEIIPLAEVPRRFTKAVHLRLSTTTTDERLLLRVQAALRAHKGACPIFFCFVYPDGRLVFLEAHEHYAITPTEAFIHDVEAILGEDTVWVKVDNEKLKAVINNGNRWERRPVTVV